MYISKCGVDTQIYHMQTDVRVLHPMWFMWFLLSFGPTFCEYVGTNKCIIVTDTIAWKILGGGGDIWIMGEY